MLTRIHQEKIAAATHVPTAGCDLTHLTNDELIAGTRRLVGSSNQVFAMLLAHLAEVEARGIHRERACSSLYTYCIYELRFSEDAAFRRVSAARLVKRFPALYDAIASGELHLTGLLMLGPQLTAENHLEVLGRAKHRTKKELGKLLRTLQPLPDLPARIEPLGPAPARPATTRPSWEAFVESLSPPVRELPPGDAPRDWVGAELQLQPAPARPGAAPISQPLRYSVQFSAQEEYVQLVERAKALLSHAHARSSLEEIHFRALQLLVADLEKRRFAKTARSRKPSTQAPEPASESNAPRPRSRHIPSATKRVVYERDEARCSYVDASGQRCRETHCLELHHLEPFARGGAHAPTNLTLRCRAHNALAAEQDFGPEHVAEARSARRHEPFEAQSDNS